MEAFSDDADPRLFFEAKGHLSALKALLRNVNEGVACQLLSGDAGVGKTLLKTCLLLRLDPAIRCVSVTATNHRAHEIHAHVKNELETESPARETQNSGAEKCISRVVIVVDDVDECPGEQIESLVHGLLEIDNKRIQCQVIVVGRGSAIAGKIAAPGKNHRKPAVVTISELGPMEAVAYITHRWRVARGSDSIPFCDDAIDEIYRRVGGNPRAIHRLARTVIFALESSGLEQADADFVARVADGCYPIRALETEIEHARAGAKRAGRPAMAAVNHESQQAGVDPLSNVPVSYTEPGWPGPSTSTAREGLSEMNMRELTERMERAVERASSMISSVDACEHRLASHHQNAEQSLARLEDLCTRAEQVYTALVQSAEQIGSMSEATDERIGLLVDSLEASDRARREWESADEEWRSSRARTHQELERTWDAKLADVQRCFAEQSTRIGSLEAITERVSEVVRQGLSKLNAAAESRRSEIQERAEQIESRLFEVESNTLRQVEKAILERRETATREFSAIQSRVVEQIESKISDAESNAIQRIETSLLERQEAATSDLSAIQSRVVEQMESKISDAESSAIQRLETSLLERREAATSDLSAIQSRVVEQVNRVAKDHTSAFNVLADQKVQQLASQLQASREAVRLISECTIAAQKKLGELADERREVDATSQQLADEREAMEDAAGKISEWREMIDPAEQRIKEAIEGAGRAADRIERLIGNAHTAETTAQARGLELAKQNSQAENSLTRFASVQAEVNKTLSSMIECNTNAGRRIESLAAATTRSEAILGRLEKDGGGVESQLVNLSQLVETAKLAQTQFEETLTIIAGQTKRSIDRVNSVTGQVDTKLTDVLQRMQDMEAARASIEQALANAEDIVSQIHSATVNASGVSERLTSITETSSDMVCDLGQQTERAEKAMERADTLFDKGSQSSSVLVGNIECADRASAALSVATHRSEQSSREIDSRLKEMAQTLDRAVQIGEAARIAVEELGRCGEDQRQLAAEARENLELGRGLVEELADQQAGAESTIERLDDVEQSLRSTMTVGVDTSRKLNESVSQGAALLAEQRSVERLLGESVTKAEQTMQAIDERTRRAQESHESLVGAIEKSESGARELAELLHAVVERRTWLESSDGVAREFFEQAESIRVKWQQLETRADSLTHQLNSMLADPKRLVVEAREQAEQLDRVSKAVRKVFAGLSQTSLQANRDIARFGEISKEANGRLTQISAETKRAMHLLREWVEEAAHAQSRLARALHQVPAIGQTHPPDGLSQLRDVSLQSIPGTLGPDTAKFPREAATRRREESSDVQDSSVNSVQRSAAPRIKDIEQSDDSIAKADRPVGLSSSTRFREEMTPVGTGNAK